MRVLTLANLKTKRVHVYIAAFMAALFCAAGATRANALIDTKLRMRSHSLKTPLPWQWPQTSEDAQHLKVSRRTVQRLLARCGEMEPTRGVPHDVSEFGFFPLRGNELYLVAIADGFMTSVSALVVARVDGGKCHSMRLDAMSSDLSKNVVDTEGNGRYRLIGTELVGGYEGAFTISILSYALYELQDNALVDVSAEHAGWFRANILAKMASDAAKERKWRQQILAGAEGQISDQEKAEFQTRLAVADVYVQFAHDDYLRRVERKPNAGVEHARQWEHSHERQIVNMAIDSYEAINAQEAGAALNRLGKSNDKYIAQTAEMSTVKRCLRMGGDYKHCEVDQKLAAPK